jgi:hypothetical protein
MVRKIIMIAMLLTKTVLSKIIRFQFQPLFILKIVYSKTIMINQSE